MQPFSTSFRGEYPPTTSFRGLEPCKTSHNGAALPLVRAFVGLLLVLSVAVDAAAQTAQVSLTCNEIPRETLDAFEARARAELAVRQTAGRLTLSCDPGTHALLTWTSVDGPTVQRQVALSAVSSDALLEVFIEVLAGTPAATAPPPETPTSDEASTSEPHDPQTKEPGDVEAGPAPLPDDTVTQVKPPPPPDAAAQASANQPKQTQETPEDVGPVIVAEPQSVRWSVGAAASSWGSQLALGAELNAIVPLTGHIALTTNAGLMQGAFGTEGFTTRNYGAAAGVRSKLFGALSATLALGGGATQVQAPANYFLTRGQDAALCNVDVGDNGGLCGFLGGLAELSYSIGSGSWRPEIAAQLAWARSISARADTEESGATRTVEVPSLRPGVVLRLVLVPDSRGREQ